MFQTLPDGEQALIDKLRQAFPNLAVSTREPPSPTSAWVRVFRLNGEDQLRGMTGAETYAIESWHQNRESLAVKQANDLRTRILQWGFNRGQKFTNGDVSLYIRSTGATVPVNLPDPDGRARYTFNATFVLRHH